MVQSVSKPLTLAEFLKLPETKPPSEYAEGKVRQKPMPKTRHARLQRKLLYAINEVSEKSQIAYAFPELRCTFGERSVIPDIAVLQWQNIEMDANGEPLDDVYRAPDWTIEILSPDQSSNHVMGNILHCLKHGCTLGWLLDLRDRSILIFQPQQQPELKLGEDNLTSLDSIPLNLTVNQVFGWLKMQEL
ncbi:Uma2 family endonuclease [Synechococcales cyanobacterium C]|uniref:Uma2 family endonuclease n=1 Tax=Petrachloros mirabilis ULC683 TaxID=2781853 RepID=A0A8K2A855_9CYAN|nr:Uma2 family endonuclease [Petrachloros mirabilis]NCJ07626.1 Uma2 family endonuclease [Petrachloros mirabilis ULC683]